jgi:hypothetical protein
MGWGRFDYATKRATWWLPDTTQAFEEDCPNEEQFQRRWQELSGIVPKVDGASSGGSKSTSARMSHPPTNAKFSPPVAVVSETTEKPPVAGRLPDLPGIKWEWKEKGTVVEAWDCPSGQRNRENSTYLGRLGKKKLQALDLNPPEEVFAFIREWIQSKRTEKGIQ